MINLSSQVIQRILLYFILNPNKVHHLRELAEILNQDPGNLSRSLNQLTTQGFVQFTEKGRLKFFSLNTEHPLYKEIKSILLKTAGVEILLKKALEQLENIEQAFIYGSFASNTIDAMSDIDLMIIGSVSTLSLAKILKPLEKQFGRDINYRIFSKKEFHSKQATKDPFITSVMKGKRIMLIGDK
ncbi:MAG: nucleotidyltransferase domain-containing protein [bacterium]|nr:nucleotidyltransferase domain-containing protein [bacterium]MBU1916509.1 nucleotidyltransferase domain-containing protein [bacterium]